MLPLRQEGTGNKDSTMAARFPIVLAGPLDSINTWSSFTTHSIEAQPQIASTGHPFTIFLLLFQLAMVSEKNESDF